MEYQHKLKKYIILAWLSLGCLIFILIKWNVDHYKTEKKDLKDALITEVELSVSKYKDSVFNDLVIFLDNGLGGVIDSLRMDTFVDDTVAFDFSDDIDVSLEGWLDQDLNSSEVDTQINILINRRFDDLSVQISKDSAVGKPKIFEDADSLGKDVAFGKVASSFRLTFDRGDKTYARIKSLLNERLKARGLPSQFSIMESDSLTEAGAISVSMNVSDVGGLGKPTKMAVWTDDGSYLWKKVASDILISMALLGLIGFTMFFSIRNWREQLRLANMRKEFVSNMTHELKTPISTIGIALEALESYGAMVDEDRREEYLNISKGELGRLQLLVEKVLQMSQDEGHGYRVQTETLDLSEVVDKVLVSIKPKAEQGGYDMSVDIDHDLFVLGDRVHLTNVVFNLLDNAIKYSSSIPEIGVLLTKEDDCAVLRVKDKGVGISAEDHKRVFDRFFRVPSGDRHNVKGHGLGLHYVKSIVEAHGGSVDVQSKVGQGATFTIKLPLS